ncbi:MAG: type VI secretion system-associated protein TagF [Janthinobacterium lividum]
MIARLFGKLPAHGDFVCRGFVRAECDSYDRWLSASLADALAEHGEAFGRLYESAPPWRFALDDGRGGRAGGAIALSQDSAGRRFPVYLEVQALSAAAPVAVAAAAEELLFRAIAERWTADALAGAAGAVTCLKDEDQGDEAQGDEAGLWWLEGAGAADALTGDRPRDLLSRMLAATVTGDPA